MMTRYMTLTICLAASLLLGAGCSRSNSPASSDYISTGVRYAPATIVDGPARLWAIEQAELEAKRELRNRILSKPELAGLPEDIKELTIRSDYMRAKLDELIRRAEVVDAQYAQDRRRAEVTIEIDPAAFKAELMNAYQSALKDEL